MFYMGEHKSDLIPKTCGVPQGSVHRPLLFNYVVLLAPVIHENSVAYHSYADSTQSYLALSTDDSG